MRKTTGWIKATLLAAALFAALSGAVSAQTIADVPASHWAYEAVRELVARGYLTLESGRFEGDRPVDRYTLATVVARILREFETGAAAPQSEEDVALLRAVVNEFRAELVRAFAEIEAAEQEGARNARDIAVLESGMSQVRDLVNQLTDRSLELETQISAIDAARRAELSATAAQIRGQIEEVSRLVEAEGRSRAALEADLVAAIEALRRESAQESDLNREAITNTQLRVARLEDDLLNQGTALAGVQQQLNTMLSRIQGDLDTLKGQLEAQIHQELQLEKERLVQLADAVELALGELRSELNAQWDRLFTLNFLLEQLRNDFDARARAVDERFAGNEEQIALLQGDIAAIRDLIGQLTESSRGLQTLIEQFDEASRAQLGETAATIGTQISELARLVGEERDAREALRSEVLDIIAGLRQESSRGIEETRVRVDDLEQEIRLNLEAQERAIEDLRGQLDRRTAQIGSTLDDATSALEAEFRRELELQSRNLEQLARGVDLALGELRGQLNVQVEELIAQSTALERLKTDVETQIAEIRERILANAGRIAENEASIAELEERLARQGASLAQADIEILGSLEELARSVGALEEQIARLSALADRLSATESRVESVERQVLAMQSQIGLSEEQLAALKDRLMTELESQLQHNILLASSLERDLNSLRNEFNSYRQATEAQLSRASQGSMLGIVGVLLGLIGLVTN